MYGMLRTLSVMIHSSLPTGRPASSLIPQSIRVSIKVPPSFPIAFIVSSDVFTADRTPVSPTPTCPHGTDAERAKGLVPPCLWVTGSRSLPLRLIPLLGGHSLPSPYPATGKWTRSDRLGELRFTSFHTGLSTIWKPA